MWQTFKDAFAVVFGAVLAGVILYVIGSVLLLSTFILFVKWAEGSI